jgi:hypothetical protein
MCFLENGRPQTHRDLCTQKMLPRLVDIEVLCIDPVVTMKKVQVF